MLTQEEWDELNPDVEYITPEEDLIEVPMYIQQDWEIVNNTSIIYH